MLRKAFGKLAGNIKIGWTQYPALISLSVINFVMLLMLEHSIFEEGDARDILIASLKTGLIVMPVVFILEYLSSIRKGIFLWALIFVILLAGAIWFSQYWIPKEGVYEVYYLVTSSSLSFLIAAVAPVVLRLGRIAYWQYLQKLIVTFATSILYVSFVFLALVLAFQALEYLFGIKNTAIGMYDITSLSYTLMHTLVFVSLFTIQDPPDRHGEIIWPFLKTLAQGVFLPIASLYMIILYAYAIRIMVISEWPRGWITNLVFGLSIVGLGTFAILYPYLVHSYKEARASGHHPWWVKGFNKYFFALLIPLSLLQLLSIGIRINAYGWTIPRYAVVLIGLYIFGTCLYLVFSKRRDLRVLSVAFLSFFLIGAFSPVSALRVSKQSLSGIIKDYLIKIDPNGKGILPEKDSGVIVPDSTANILSEKLMYMMDEYGPKTLIPFLPEGCQPMFVAAMEKDLRVGQGTLLRDLSLCTSIDFVAAQAYTNVQTNQYFYLSGNSSNTVLRTDISGFELSYRFYVSQSMENPEMSLSKDTVNILTLRRSDGSFIGINLNVWIEKVSIDLTQLNELNTEYQVWDTLSEEGIPIRLVLHRVEGYYNYGDIVITGIEGMLYE